jgi:hypothetical protein
MPCAARAPISAAEFSRRSGRNQGSANSLLQTSPSFCANASPLNFVDPGAPPASIVHILLSPLTASIPVIDREALSPTPGSDSAFTRYFWY